MFQFDIINLIRFELFAPAITSVGSDLGVSLLLVDLAIDELSDG